MKAKIGSSRGPTYRQEKKAHSRGCRAVAGVDESGVGPLAGPVVAAAVILQSRVFESRIDDCKRLTPAMRARAYAEIVKKSIFSVSVIGCEVIDAVNIYKATKLAMEKAVAGLALQPDFLLVDGRIKLSVPCDVLNVVRGDGRCLSIACASVIAKVWRDGIMERLHAAHPRYGFKRHKGYGTPEHLRKLKKNGPSPVHRFSFAPVAQCGKGRHKDKRSC